MARIGRPPLEEPMSFRVSVRFTEKEYKRLKVYADYVNKTMTEALKDGKER